jgi:3-oxoacyl-[acyl-carrier-protein] synthase III
LDKIPLYEKMNLTIEQASEYSNIGENTLRQYIKDNPNERFILYVGKKILIKRKEFIEWNSSTFIVK